MRGQVRSRVFLAMVNGTAGAPPPTLTSVPIPKFAAPCRQPLVRASESRGALGSCAQLHGAMLGPRLLLEANRKCVVRERLTPSDPKRPTLYSRIASHSISRRKSGCGKPATIIVVRAGYFPSAKYEP
jgi:hypothetical protein